jgi:DNA-binding transcriptional LysR family regulator
MSYDGRLLAGLTVLMAVVEAGSMTRAAEALGLTPSGVGRAIQRLEARVGVRLLHRTTRSLRLTDEGRRFWGRVGPLLDGVEEAALEAAGSAQIVRGRLRVNVDPFFSRLVLARELTGFLAKHRELRVELIMRDQRRRSGCRRLRHGSSVRKSARGQFHRAQALGDAHPDCRFSVVHRRAR